MKFSVIKYRSLWWSISAAIILAGIVSMAISWTRPDIRAPLRPSLDFIGGTRLQFELDCTKPENCKPIDLAAVREVLDTQGLGRQQHSSYRQRTARFVAANENFGCRTAD
jgi:preprotein translocase subunit SecF